MSEMDVYSAVAGEIMTPYVIMLKMDANFRDVVDTLYKNDISAVFIHDTSANLYYIISQAEIVNYLSIKGLEKTDLPSIPVSEIMVGPVELIDVDTTVDNVIRFMAEHNYKRVLISREGKAIGVVSGRDIMMWNNTYFRSAKAQILLFLDNINSCILARHIFEDNIEDEVKNELIDIYGGALKAISIITDEIINRSGNLYHLHKDKRSILIEPYKNITGILICDYNSIELRRKLKQATEKFYNLNSSLLDACQGMEGVNVELDISEIIPIFE